MTMHPTLRTLALTARRHAHRVPEPIRERLRASEAFRAPVPPELEAWDAPLMATSPSPAASRSEVAASPRGAGRPIGSVSVGVPRPGAISCVLITGPMAYGGLAGVVADLARGLSGCGVRVHVAVLGDAAPPPIGRLAAQLITEGVLVSHLARSGFADWLATVSPDVVSAHGTPDWSLRAANKLGIPVVDTLHGGHTFFGAGRSEAARRAELSSTVVAVSGMIRTQFLSACPSVSPERVVTIPNATAAPVFEAGTRAGTRRRWGVDREFVFVSLGRFSVQKNAFGLVAAFCALDQVRYPSHLVVAGDVDDPGYAAQVTRLRDRSKHPDRVHLRRSGPSHDILAGADGFVQNSFFEGWALASMEALVAGLPTISSEVAGAREQLTSARPVGRLVDNPLGDPLAADWQSTDRHKFASQSNRDQLVQAMQEVIEHRDEWARDRPRIAAESRQRFDLGAFARRHTEVLSATAAGESPPSTWPS